MNPTDGLWIWIWNLQKCEGGNVAAIAQRVRDAGARGVILKIADGGHGFKQGSLADWQDVIALQQAGIECATWSYHYGDAVSEAAGVLDTLENCRPTFHVLDVEQEVEDSTAPVSWARSIVGMLRGATQTPITYSALPAVDEHTRLPYYQLSAEASLPVLPQLYYVGLEWSPARTVATFYNDASLYGLDGPTIAPAYEDAPLAGAGSSDADLDDFLTLVAAHGAAGLSVWTYEAMDAAAWARAKRAAAALAPAPQPEPQPTPQPVSPDSQRYRAAQAAIKIAAAGLDDALSDDEAFAEQDDAERQIYAELYGASAPAWKG